MPTDNDAACPFTARLRDLEQLDNCTRKSGGKQTNTAGEMKRGRRTLASSVIPVLAACGRRSLRARIGGAGPVQHDGSIGAGSDTGTTSVAAARIDEWGLARIDLQDRLAAANVSRLALAACQTQLVHDVWNRGHLRFRRLDYRHTGIRSFRPGCAYYIARHIPPRGMRVGL